MAGHQMFHDAIVHFTTDYMNSLPRKLSYYKKSINSKFKILLIECEKGSFACSGTIKNLSRFIDDFSKLVSEEEKKAVSLLLDHDEEELLKKSKNEVSIALSCPLCDFNTKEVALYRRHIRAHKAQSSTDDEEIIFKCDKCLNKVSETKDLNVYIRHVKTIHSSKKAALCELCGLAFKRVDVLRNHKLHVHGPGPKRTHRCDKCPKEFRCKAHLISHYQVHDKRKEFECEQCDTRFKTEASRDKHVVYKHSNPKSFKCDKCRRGFGTKQNLIQHLAVHEKEILFDAESQARAITEQIALHIQEQFRAEVENCTSFENASAVNSVVGASAAPSSVNSPTPHEPPASSEADTHHPASIPTLSVQSLSSVSVTQPSQEHRHEVKELNIAPLPLPPVYPSRTPSVTSQYAGFNGSSRDNNEALDEIFPQSAQDQVEENFDSHYEYERKQEALDLVFGQDVCPPDNHQISRPGSVGSHHTEFSESRSLAAQVIEKLLPAVHYRRAGSAVASPQSVCSNQYACQSRPPSAGSIAVPSYHPSPYNIPPPEIVFSQSMSCASDITHNDMQVVLTDLYEKPSPTPPTIQQTMHFVHTHNQVTSSHNHGMVIPNHELIGIPTRVRMVVTGDNGVRSAGHNHLATANHDHSIVTSVHNHNMGTAKDHFTSIAKHLVNPQASYQSQMQPSCFTDQFGSSPLYTNTSLSQGCETIDSNTRCITPQNFPNSHPYSQQASNVSHRTIDDFGNPIVNTDTLLLPPTNTNNDIIPELHTPNKNFTDMFV